MRTISVTFGGVHYAMPVNFAALRAVAERAGDPFQIVMRMGRDGTGAMTGTETVNALVAGALCAGAELSSEDLAEAALEDGITSLTPSAAEYVLALVTGKSKHADNKPNAQAAKK